MDEKPPTFADIVVGLMISSGFMLLLTAIPLGLFLSWQASHKDGWDFTWTAILGLTITTGVALNGLLLLLLSSVICRFRWGFWPDVFWDSKKKDPAHKASCLISAQRAEGD
jgi:hypothetical protein